LGPIGTSNDEGNNEHVLRDRHHRYEHDLLREAAADAINTAGQSVRDLRGAEVVKQGIHVGDGGELIYRTKIQPSSTSRNRRRVRRVSSLGLLGSHHRKHRSQPRLRGRSGMIMKAISWR
jgi:flavin-binding protein dodecin